jgi:hypothetical protein
MFEFNSKHNEEYDGTFGSYDDDDDKSVSVR